jgi:hypothetical protein
LHPDFSPLAMDCGSQGLYLKCKDVGLDSHLPGQPFPVRADKGLTTDD